MPVSNLTNLLRSGTFQQPFATFALRMALPQLLVLAVLYGSLLGANVGPCITVFASLATVLVFDVGRRRGVKVEAGRPFWLGLWQTPLLLVAGAAGLWVTLR